MFKSVVKCIAIASLAAISLTPAMAQSAPGEPVNGDPNYVKTCDASACYYYWNTGDGNWVLVRVEPIGRGGERDVN